METYEVYWSDLTDEAQERLKGLYHENIDISPLVIIDVEIIEPSEDLEN